MHTSVHIGGRSFMIVNYLVPECGNIRNCSTKLIEHGWHICQVVSQNGI